MADKITRIAIVDSNRCKPKRCAQECKKVYIYLNAFFIRRTMADPLVPVMSCSENGCEKTLNQGLQDWTHCSVGKLCIEVKSSDKIAFISEFLCIGCGICVKR